MPSSDCNGHQAPTEAKGINAGKTSTYIIKLKIKREEKRELITFCEGQKKSIFHLTMFLTRGSRFVSLKLACLIKYCSPPKPTCLFSIF